MKLSKILTKVTIVFLAFNVSAVDRQEMLNTLEKISTINRQLNSEITDWNAEKESLKLQLSLLKASMEDQNEEQKSLLKKLEELKEKKKSLLKVLGEQEVHQKKIDSLLNKNSAFLISASNKIPQSLQFLIKEDLLRLNTILKDTSTPPEVKLNAINALTVAILKTQKEVHLVKEVFTLNNQKMEARALYLGTYTGYFKNTEKKLYGRFLLKNGQWTAVEDSSLNETIDALFSQFDQKGAPKLIGLPVGESK